MVQCTRCGCSWGKSGFYFSKGKIQQPCKVCRLDARSAAYLTHRESILETRREAYYNEHEAYKAYYREYRRARRAQTTA